MGSHAEAWAGLLVALGASAVAICMTGLTCGGLGGTTGRTGSFGYRYIHLYGAFCHEGLETGGDRQDDEDEEGRI